MDAKSEIIEAAREQFLMNGYEGARLQKIADNIGVTKAMIHYYFNTKKELFERVYVQSLDQIFGELPEILEEDLPLFKKIEGVIEYCLNIADTQPRALSFVVTESNRKKEWLQPAIEEHINLRLNTFDSELEEAASNYEIASVSAPNLLMQIFSLCYYPVLSDGLHQSFFKDSSESPKLDAASRKGVVLDTIFNWLTA